jgi:hypothetical protein
MTPLRAPLLSITIAASLLGEQALAGDLPSEVQGVLAGYRQDCKEVGSELSDPAGAVARQDLDGDGRPDLLVDMTKARCDGVYTPFCGTAGCPLLIFVQRTGGKLFLIFDGPVQSYRVSGGAGRKTMLFRLHGGFCGRGGTDVCTRRVTISGRPFSFVDRSS